ncbi:MAG: ATP-binding protein [Alphaproteobacteria bacterium]
MILRLAYDSLLTALKRSPAVALLGARQVGKTTLAKTLGSGLGKPSIYLDLERPSDLAKIQEPELYLRDQHNTLVILDEVQRLPELFPVLRGVIDERIASGETTTQFLLLGSASLDVVQGASESLAGRVSYFELSALNLMETHLVETQGESAVNTLWLRGGFPRSLLQPDDESSLGWRQDFIASYLERDIPALGPRIPAESLRRFWTMLAHCQGSPVNGPTLASNLSLSVPTIHRYVDILGDLLLLRSLRPWSGNIGKRLVKTPKPYVRDSGLCHALLNIGSLDELLGHPVVGTSWEGFVIENLLSVAPRRVTPWFYRTHAGAEIDLVLEVTPQQRIAIEIKRTLTPKLTKSFTAACADLEPTERYFVYAGEEPYPLAQDVTAMPLLKMMERIQAL